MSSSPPRYALGINTAFAVKRWPEPERWSALIGDLGVDVVQHTFDLVDLDGPPDHVLAQADAVREACRDRGLRLHSTFTGLAAYSSNLLLHPDRRGRDRAEDWYRRAIDFTARAGAGYTGGHIGAFTVSDWRDRKRHALLTEQLEQALGRLAAVARTRGLEGLLVENMAAAREPSTMSWMRRLLAEGNSARVPVALCLDVGHHCVPGTEGDERDPYAWLEQLGAAAPVVHLQQTDATADHHWPFTAEMNAIGRIGADEVLAALGRSGAEEVALVLEVVPPFEAADDGVLEDIATSIRYWKEALNRNA
ncbi:MAG: sugar phosphate isomerase/epimerase [Actinomycetota bacterium]|nr:sugar phosphate isomerase/epimerase [Actinomycetota bacterium]